MTTADLIEKVYGVGTAEVDNPLAVASIGTTPVRILDNDPGGLQLTIINSGTQDVYIWTDASVSATNGILLQANGGSYEIDFTRFMRMATREWWAVTAANSTTLAIKRTVILGSTNP